jgi:hypothetical protein
MEKKKKFQEKREEREKTEKPNHCDVQLVCIYRFSHPVTNCSSFKGISDQRSMVITEVGPVAR